MPNASTRKRPRRRLSPAAKVGVAAVAAVVGALAISRYAIDQKKPKLFTNNRNEASRESAVKDAVGKDTVLNAVLDKPASVNDSDFLNNTVRNTSGRRNTLRIRVPAKADSSRLLEVDGNLTWGSVTPADYKSFDPYRCLAIHITNNTWNPFATNYWAPILQNGRTFSLKANGPIDEETNALSLRMREVTDLIKDNLAFVTRALHNASQLDKRILRLLCVLIETSLNPNNRGNLDLVEDHYDKADKLVAQLSAISRKSFFQLPGFQWAPVAAGMRASRDERQSAAVWISKPNLIANLMAGYKEMVDHGELVNGRGINDVGRLQDVLALKWLYLAVEGDPDKWPNKETATAVVEGANDQLFRWVPSESAGR